MSSAIRSIPRCLPRCLTAARPAQPCRLLQRCYSGPKTSSGDYGSGIGDPKGEKPKEQGPNPSAVKGHPGPPPPNTGQGSRSSTKGASEGYESSGQEQSGQKTQFSTATLTGSFRSYHTARALQKEKRPKSTEGLSPKILHESPPGESDQPDDVRKHNEEMNNRAERAKMGVRNEDAERDKVSPKFWSGHGGQAEHHPGGEGKGVKH